MNKYPNTTLFVRKHLEPLAIEHEMQYDTRNPAHLLWMLIQIEKEDMDEAKAGRWIGWIAAVMTHVYNTLPITEIQIRDMIRQDVEEFNAKSH